MGRGPGRGLPAGRRLLPRADETVGPWIDGSSFARLCFTFATSEEIDEGSRRLALALRS